MASTAKKLSDKGRRPRQRSRLWLVSFALLGAAVVAAGIGITMWRRLPVSAPPSSADRTVEPPSLEASDVDPAVMRAIQAARLAVVQSPHAAERWGRLAMIFKAHGFSSEANACFVQAEQLDPHEPRWSYHQAIELAERDPDMAIAKLQKAIESFDRSAEAPRLRLGELLLRQGRFDPAEQQFRQLLLEHPGQARAHLDVARLAVERGELQASLSHLHYAMADKRTQKASCILAAEVQQRLGNLAAAEQQRRRAAQLPEDPPWPDPYLDEIVRLRTGKQVGLARADRLLSQERFSDAIALLRDIVRDYPDSDWAWLLLGRAFLGRKELPAAEEALRKAASLASASIEVQFYLGVVLLLREDPRAAATYFRRATEIKPDFAEAHHNLGYCLLRQGDQTGAIEAFRRAVLCKPNYSDAHRDLGDMLAQKGQLAESLAHLRYALQLNPADPRAKKLLEQVMPRIAVPTGP
jgi:tetratricopeptide (TPR) repeat protein